MGVITSEQEVSCPLISAKKLFKCFVFDADELMPRIIPHFFKSFETVEGDGGVGSIKLVTFTAEGRTPAKHRVEEVDEENHVYGYSVIEGGILGDDLESVSYVFKFEGGAEGGCTVKISATYRPKSEEHSSIKEKIEKVKEATEGFINTLEAHLHAHADD